MLIFTAGTLTTSNTPDFSIIIIYNKKQKFKTHKNVSVMPLAPSSVVQCSVFILKVKCKLHKN